MCLLLCTQSHTQKQPKKNNAIWIAALRKVPCMPICRLLLGKWFNRHNNLRSGHSTVGSLNCTLNRLARVKGVHHVASILCVNVSLIEGCSGLYVLACRSIDGEWEALLFSLWILTTIRTRHAHCYVQRQSFLLPPGLENLPLLPSQHLFPYQPWQTMMKWFSHFLNRQM